MITFLYAIKPLFKALFLSCHSLMCIVSRSISIWFWNCKSMPVSLPYPLCSIQSI